MKRIKRIAAVITLLVFSFSNISLYASEINLSKSTLAPYTNFVPHKDTEFKDLAQIRLGILKAVKSLKVLSSDTIRTLGDTKFSEFSENSVFDNNVRGRINFNNVDEVSVDINGGKVLIEDGNYLFTAKTEAGITYHCLISEAADGVGVNISIASDRVLAKALAKGDVKFTHASPDGKDGEIVALYLSQEVSPENSEAIDPWIAERMRPDRAEYAVDTVTSKNALYNNDKRKIYDTANFTDLIDRLEIFLTAIGVPGENINKIKQAMSSKPLVLIPYDNEDELPVFTIEGKPVRVYGHSSVLATYAFVPREIYEKAVSGEEWPPEIMDTIRRIFVHETGAQCGKAVRLKNGRAWNVLDECFERLYDRKDGLLKLPELRKEFGEELQTLAPVNLLELAWRLDYAAGMTEEGRDKGIRGGFNRMIGYLLAVAGIAAVGVPVAYNEINKMQEREEQRIVAENKVAEARKIKHILDWVKNPYAYYSYVDIIEDLRELEKPATMTMLPAIVEVLTNGYEKPCRFRAMTIISELGPAAKEVALPALVELLEDEDYRIREDAVRTLGNFGPAAKDAIPALLKVWRYDEKQLIKIGYPVREEADEALGKIGLAVVPDMMKILEDKDCEDRYRAAIVLGNVGPAARGAIPALLKILSEYRNGEYRDRWTGEERVVIFAVEALGKIGPAAKDAIPTLLQMLKIHYGFLPNSASDALSGLGLSAVPALRKALWEDLDRMKWTFRQDVAKTFGKMGPAAKDAVPDLMKMIKRKGEVTFARYSAIIALGDIGPVAIDAAPFLVELLKDKDSIVRFHAAMALSKIDLITARCAVPVLKEVLENDSVLAATYTDETFILRDEARAAIKKIEAEVETPSGSSEKETEAKKETKSAQPAATEQLEVSEEEIQRMKELTAILLGGDYSIKYNAFKELKAKGRAATLILPELIKAMEDVRWGTMVDTYLIDIISKQGEPAVDPLIKVLETERYREGFREVAVRTLELIGPVGIPRMRETLKEKENPASLYIVRAIQDIGPGAKDAVPEMVDIIKDLSDLVFKEFFKTRLESDEKEARVARAKLLIQSDVKALVSIGQAAVPALMELLDSSSVAVHYYAMSALGQIGDERPLSRMKEIIESGEFDDRRMREMEGLVCLIEKAIEERSGSSEAEGELEPVTGEIPTPVTARDARIKDLMGELTGMDTGAVRHAMKELEARGKAAIPALKEALNSGDIRLSCLAAYILGEMGPVAAEEGAVEAIVKAAKEKGEGYWAFRRIAIGSIDKIGSPNKEKAADRDVEIEVLILKLTDGDDDTRIAAAWAIADRGPAAGDAVPALIKMIRHENETLQNVITIALSKMGPGAFPRLIAALEDKNKNVCIFSTVAISRMGQDVVGPLSEALKSGSEQVRMYAAIAVGLVKPAQKEIIPELRRLAKEDPNPLVRDAAGEAILNIEPGEDAHGSSEGETAEKDAISMMRDEAFWLWRTENMFREAEVVETLWQAAQGMPKDVAMKELARLAPNVPAETRAAWILAAGSIVFGLNTRPEGKHKAPADDVIKGQIAPKLVEEGAHVFFPKSQISNGTAKRYRKALKKNGGNLTLFEDARHLEGMMADRMNLPDPKKAVVMLVGMDPTLGIDEFNIEEFKKFEALQTKMRDARFLRFDRTKDISEMDSEALRNYEDEILSILLAVRSMTENDLAGGGSLTYQFLRHLLENYMPDGISVEDYIKDIATDKAKFIKNALKARPSSEYEVRPSAVNALMSV